MTYRGYILERFDPSYIKEISGINNINTSYPLIPLGSLLTERPMYGANETAIDGDPQTDVRYIRITDIDADGNLQNEDWKTAKRVDEKYTLDENDILFARSGATVGKAFIYKREYEKAIFAGYMIRFRFDKTRVNPLFAFYYTLLSRYRSWVRTIQRPSGQPNINSREVKSFEIPLPSLDIQNHIVEIIQSAYAQKKQKEQGADTLLDSIGGYVLAELGIKIPVVEEKKCFVVRWGAVNDRLDPHFYHPRFEKLLAVLHQGPHEILGNITELCHQKWKPEEHQEDTFRYIEINGVSRDTGEVSFSKVPTKEAPSRAQMMVQKDDIIVSLTRPHHGSIALIDDDLDGCIISTGFAVLREIKDPTLSRLYLYSVLRNKLCLHQMLQRSSGGNYPAITKEQLMQILLPIPSPNRQKEIVKELSRHSAKARRLREEATKEWEAAKGQLEEQLLTGEVF